MMQEKTRLIGFVYFSFYGVSFEFDIDSIDESG